jgi:hypothetical protein
MQTFLPYPDFVESARCLDWRRLGKQRSEAKTIFLTITENRKPWSNHPAVNMWRGYEEALKLYHNVVIEEWVNRGYNNNMELFSIREVTMPSWIGDDLFHNSHKAALLFKDKKFYSKFEWQEGEFYLWPYWIDKEYKDYVLRNPKK